MLDNTAAGQGAKYAYNVASNAANKVGNRVANSVVGKYMAGLHRAGNKANPMAEMGKKVDDLHKQAFPN